MYHCAGVSYTRVGDRGRTPMLCYGYPWIYYPLLRYTALLAQLCLIDLLCLLEKIDIPHRQKQLYQHHGSDRRYIACRQQYQSPTRARCVQLPARKVEKARRESRVSSEKRRRGLSGTTVVFVKKPRKVCPSRLCHVPAPDVKETSSHACCRSQVAGS